MDLKDKVKIFKEFDMDFELINKKGKLEELLSEGIAIYIVCEQNVYQLSKQFILIPSRLKNVTSSNKSIVINKAQFDAEKQKLLNQDYLNQTAMFSTVFEYYLIGFISKQEFKEFYDKLHYIKEIYRNKQVKTKIS